MAAKVAPKSALRRWLERLLLPAAAIDLFSEPLATGGVDMVGAATPSP